MLKKLFEPFSIGGCEIPNRLVVPAMVTNYCNYDGTVTERYIRYMEEKARGGWGLIITEDYCVQPDGKGYSRIPGLYKDEQIEGVPAPLRGSPPPWLKDLLPDVPPRQADDPGREQQHHSPRPGKRQGPHVPLPGARDDRR